MTLGALYRCAFCRFESPSWTNICPTCRRYNSIGANLGALIIKSTSPDIPPIARQITGIGIFDDVMLGGLVLGSSLLIGGIAGAGKSTMILQVAGGLANAGLRIAYVCSEEDPTTVISVARRVGAIHENLDMIRTTDGGEALALVKSYDVAIFDSIQKLCLMAGQIIAPRTRILVSQLNKMGEVVGERSNEHDPDVLLTADFNPNDGARILETTKNRHGPLRKGPYELTDGGALGFPCKSCGQCVIPCKCPPKKRKKRGEEEQFS